MTTVSAIDHDMLQMIEDDAMDFEEIMNQDETVPSSILLKAPADAQNKGTRNSRKLSELDD